MSRSVMRATAGPPSPSTGSRDQRELRDFLCIAKASIGRWIKGKKENVNGGHGAPWSTTSHRDEQCVEEKKFTPRNRTARRGLCPFSNCRLSQHSAAIVRAFLVAIQLVDLLFSREK